MLDPSHDVTPAAEPAYCPACELKHTRRPDWLCPRCGMPVESDVPVQEARRAPQPQQEEEREFPRGSMVAGAILAVSSGAFAFPFAKYPGEHRWPLLAAVLILAVLGLELLLKVFLARWVAAGSAAVAAVLVSEDLLRVRLPGLFRDPLPPGVRQQLRNLIGDHSPANLLFFMGFFAGCLLLIVGRPRAVRIAAGLLFAAPLVVVEIARACAG